MADLPAGLAADCARCQGLCCVALPFSRGDLFAEEKPAGRPCRHLTGEFRCGIHADLATTGWRGCVSYDCFGAGQLVTQRTYPGRDWRTDPALAAEMFRVFAVVRQLHEIRVLLADPACAAPPYAAEAADLDDELARLAGSPPETLLAVDLDHARRRAGRIFSRVAADRGGPSHRGAWLMGADLRDLDLTDADLLGADLRGADLSGADLRGALFLTQPQLDAARGDARTLLPDRLTRPASWAAEADPAAG